VKIQRLDIQGFKSFAERTSIRFGQGITGVVGPNGCGKSNIVDAIRWAMGEQSARMLRGGSMQDVIFNGSDARGPMGMAEVTLSFDNDGRGVPPEYAHVGEIQVTRRLYRDGESEYEINKTPCRLKDVHDLFLGTGVGTRAYSIISQGQVSEIMRVKPEDRRRIIEEAAGITKYKARKEQATRKMESTRQNLQRVDDVTKEIGRRLGTLRRQAKKAEKYKELKGEVREIELHLATLRFFELSNAVAFDRGRAAELAELMRDDVERNTGLEGAIDEMRRGLNDDERALSDKQGRLYEIDAGLALAEQAADHAKKGHEASRRRDEDAAVEVERCREQRAVVEGMKGELEKSQRDLFSEASTDAGALDAAAAELDGHRQHRADEGRLVEQLRRQMIEASTQAAKLGSDVVNLRASLEDMEKRRDVVAQERAPLLDEIVRLDEAAQRHDAERASVEADKNAAEEERKTASDRIGEEKKALAAAQRAHDDARVELQKRRSRLSSLEEIHARYEQSPEAIKLLLKRGGPLEGRGKLLVDLFEADAEHEATIEAGLGARLQAVVVDDDEAAAAAIAFLRDGKGRGRAELIVASAQPEVASGVVIEGAVAALDVVRVGRKASPAVKAVLARLFLVPDLQTGLTLWPQARRHGVVLVTKTGDVLEPGGALKGGVADKEGQGVLRQKREMRELADDVAARDAALVELAAAVEARQAVLQGLDETLQRATDRAQSLSLKLVEVRSAWKRAADELARVRQRAEKLAADEERLAQTLQRAVVELDDKTERLKTTEAARASLDAEVATRGQGLVELDQRIAVQQEAVTTMKVRAASIAERTESLKRNLQQAQGQAADLEARLQHLQKQIDDGHVERQQLTKQEADARAQLAVLGSERATVKAALEAMRLAWELRSEALRLKEHEARGSRAKLDEARAAHGALVVRLRERELELDALVDRTIERHRVRPEEVVYDYHLRPLPTSASLSAMDDRLGELERQIDGLGPINLTAIDECRELEKRHDFLRTQADDLTHALNQLEKAIIKINRTTKKRFQETFEGINERFQQVFPRLFRGGKAWLALTDPSDMLATGVEIYAQPPGKKLGSVGLLSGGEQALTAVSLLFAIFLLKPSPFCLLDEVDAPLDESNVGRFNDMVRDVAALSQFIVITHNKKTMEVADQLYGITMEEPGISKTVNVRIQ
jgi:chromosome segregation protein